MNDIPSGFDSVIVSPILKSNGVTINPKIHRSISLRRMASENIDVDNLKKMIASPPQSFYIIDVRSPREFSDGHIDTAINIPINHLYTALSMKDEKFEATYKVNKPLKESTIVFNCGHGVRSEQAIEMAKELGYIHACHLQHGYSSWVAKALENV